MNRSTLTLIGAVTALAAVTGVAAVAAPGEDASRSATAAARKPVERSTLVCPRPTVSDVAETDYTAFTPKGEDSGKGGKGSAALYPAEEDTKGAGEGDKEKKDEEAKDKEKDKDAGDEGGTEKDAKPFLPLDEPGKPVTESTERSDAPALFGSADGRFAPGWTVQQTTTVSAGAGRGLQGTSCTTADTSFWFPGASTSEDRQDYVHLTNPDSTTAVVDLEMYGKDGREKSGAGEGITIPPRSTVPVLLSTLATEPTANVALHVLARTGRVGAQVQAVDKELGGDWLRSAADANASAVLPGIPADATSVRLVVFAPGENDADLKVRLAGKSGQITPAGYETLHVRGGMTTAVDLKDLTKGEAGSLVLSPSEGGSDATPVVAAVRVTRGKGADQETAFIPSTAPIDERATVADNSTKGSTLSLTAPGKGAKVRVTSSAGSEGGSPKSETYTVKGGTTSSFAPPQPEGAKGTYAVTVERISGGPVYGSRMLDEKQDGVPAFTVQTLPDDRGTVPVPQSGQDLSVLTDKR
ncbi:DUF5719 family protein [Streptomyces sp. NPDC054796]